MNVLKRIEKMLDLPDAEKAQVMRELDLHYQEIKEELISAGTERDKAEVAASERFGDPEAIATRLNAEHCVAPWKSALIAIIPFASVGLVVAHKLSHGFWAQAMFLLIVLFTGFILAGTVRGFRSGGRPAWLPVWTAASINLVYGLLFQMMNKLAMYYHTSPQFLIILPILIAVILAFASCRRNWRWTLAVIAILASGVVSIFLWALLLHEDQPFAVSRILTSDLIINIATTAVWVIVALRVFANHIYGGTAQAVLFLLGIWMLSSPMIEAFYIYTWWSVLGSVIIKMVTIIAFIRASSFMLKISISIMAIGIGKIIVTVVLAKTVNLSMYYYILNGYSLLTSIGAISAIALYRNIQRKRQIRYAE